MTCVVVFLHILSAAHNYVPSEAVPYCKGDRFQGRKYDIIDPAPRPFQVDEVFLVYPVQRFSYGIIIGVAFPANRPGCSDIGESLGILDRCVLHSPVRMMV